MQFNITDVETTCYRTDGTFVLLRNFKEVPIPAGDKVRLVLQAPQRQDLDPVCRNCGTPMVKGDKKVWPPHFCSSACLWADRQKEKDEKERLHYRSLGYFEVPSALRIDGREIHFADVVGIAPGVAGGERVLLRHGRWVAITFEAAKEFWKHYTRWRDCVRDGGVFQEEYLRMRGLTSNVVQASGTIISPLEKLVTQILRSAKDS